MDLRVRLHLVETHLEHRSGFASDQYSPSLIRFSVNLIRHRIHGSRGCPRGTSIEFYARARPRLPARFLAHRRGAAVLPRGVSSPRGVSTSSGACPSRVLSRCRVAMTPYWVMSRVIAVSGGCTTWLMRESSQPTIDRSSGTTKPICCATPRPVTARRSLSKMIAVGGSGDDRSLRVARAPLAGE